MMPRALPPPLRDWRRWRQRARARGMSLVEIMIVLVIMLVMVSILVLGSAQSSSARLRQSSAIVSGAVRVAYAKASAKARPLRLAFDFNTRSLQLEESDGVMLLVKNDSSGGAAAATAAEQEAQRDSERILSGPKAPRATFRPIDETGFGESTTPGKGAKVLPRDIYIKSVHCEHDDEPRVEGRGYLYFWPGGQTERCVIQLRVGPSADQDNPEGVMSLVVSPLTGKVEVRPGISKLTSPEDDRDASERPEPGGTL